MDDMHKDIQDKPDEAIEETKDATGTESQQKNDIEQEAKTEKTSDKVAELTEKLAKAEETAKKNYDNYLRSLAELDNMRKRTNREKEEYIKYATLPIIKKLLPIIDDFERAISNAENNKDFEALHKGVEMILKNLMEVIKSEGVEPIEALGKPFDPELHQPLAVEGSSQEENIVIAEMQKGYIMHGRVIRPSLVKVSK